MKKLNITYDTAEIENGEKIVGETCYTVDFADDRVADRLLDHGTSGVAVAELEKLLRTLRRYNLARPVGRLSGLDSRIEVFPTVLLALPDSDLADAAAEVTRTRSELSLYERPEDGTAAVEVEE